MLYLGRRRTLTWETTVFTPAREIFTVAEQVTALPPFSFRQVDDRTAEVAQTLANGLFGGWSRVRTPRNVIRIRCEPAELGTHVTITATGPRSAARRGVNLVRILSAGELDPRTIYRVRAIPPGPCTLVQSWAGTPYPVFLAPDHGAPRGVPVRPATPLRALEQRGHWVRVQVGGPDATPAPEGWIEADQLVAAPDLTGRDGVAVSPMGRDGIPAA